MKTIWKFELAITDTQEVSMPKGAEILSVQADDKRRDSSCQKLCVWALVDPIPKKRDIYVFQIFGTGNPVSAEKHSFLGTCQTNGGRYVWHVFHYIKPDPRDQPRWP